MRDRAFAPARWFVAWQAEIPDEGRITIVGLIGLGLGLGLAWPPAAAIVPGAVLAGTGLGLRLTHPGVAIAVIAGTTLFAVAVVVFR